MKEEKKHYKLVRDNIPDILKNKGITCYFHNAEDDEEYKNSLYNKLREELDEFIDEPCTEELADMLEVIDAIRNFHNIDINELRIVKINKKSERGGFNKKIILDTTIE